MGKIINLNSGNGAIFNYNEPVNSPIILDIPEANNSDITVFYPKKYTTIHENDFAIDYLKLKKDGFNTVLQITSLGEWNNIVVEPNVLNDTFKIVVKKRED